ncbi:rhamnosyltransferase WsaF family glycosyltransferase [Ensifer soli]|uniref:rhamnosyltransferase WsaF family glycosyltransferase n=1 Tax=Ciceribacter sp. sgz301302 TaxID=3342379 RepID=UPI0035BB7EDF
MMTTSLFDADFYLKMYPDVRSANVSPKFHFDHFGWKEDRNPSLYFDTYYYKTANPDLESLGRNPLEHFLEAGRAEGRLAHPEGSVILPDVPISHRPTMSVAIHVHVFYLSLFPEILSCLADLTIDYALYVTVCKKADVSAAEDYIRERLPAGLTSQVRLVENSGRDLGPFFHGLRDVINDYDVWCHLHTKYSPHIHFGSRWRTYLLDQLIGSDSRVRAILMLLESQTKHGVVYPDNYFLIKKFVNLGENDQEVARLFARIGYERPQPQAFADFAAGSMCWFKTKALAPLIDADFTLEEFGVEASQVDATLAHAIERAICIVPKSVGFDVTRFYAPPLRLSMLESPASCAIEDKEPVGERWKQNTPAISIAPPLELSPRSNHVNSDHLHVHWVMPDFNEGLGGHTTIFRFIKHLDAQGYYQTIWIQSPSVNLFPAIALAKIKIWYQDLSDFVVVKFLPDDVEAISGDAVIATDCWTAYPVSRMTRFKHRFYFIQDWETEFHPAGELKFMAEATYTFGFTALTAGRWLAEKSRQAGMETIAWSLGADRKVYTPPEAPPARVAYRPEPHPETIRFAAKTRATPAIEDLKPGPDGSVLPRLAFYARAYTPRRAVRLGLEAMTVLARRGYRFHVDFFGEDIDFGEKPYTYTAHGVLKPKQLAELYRKADLGIVFSCTNYSLVPLEMMACDLPVLEVDTESTRKAYPDGAVAFARPSVHDMADRMAALLDDPAERDAIVAEARAFLVEADWQRSGEIVERAIREKVLAAARLDVAPLIRTLEAEAAARVGAPALHRKPKTSVFIPTYNAGPEFATVLAALREQRFDDGYELVIIDSGSTDETEALILEAARHQRINHSTIASADFGHGRTRNAGIDQAEGEVVAILTQDACPASSGWLAALVSGFDAGTRVAGVFGRHLAYPLHDVFEGPPLAEMFARFRRLGTLYSWEREMPGIVQRGSPSWQYHLQFYSDNNSCIRKSVWREIPYPDVPWGEDMIWAWKVIKLGFEKAYADDAAVYHSHDYDPRKLTEVGREEGRMFLEHFGMLIVPDADERDEDKVVWSLAARQLAADEALLKAHGAATPELLMRRAMQHVALIKGRLRGAREQRERLNA